MMTTPDLFDRTALRMYRRRANPDALFLHQAAVDDVQDRLDMVNNAFQSVAIVSPYPEIWRDQFPEPRIVPDDDTLDLDVDAFDLVIHSMCLHWANDPIGQLIQCCRALKPDGLCLVVLLGGQTLSELRAVLSEAETITTGGLSPRIAPMPEIRDLGGLLQRAGFALPVADNLSLTVQYQSLHHLMLDLRAMGETNALSQRLRRPTRRSLFDTAQDLYARHFPGPSGTICATFDMISLTGWAPDASQPQPLRPGSAKTRLADALNTRESPLSD